MYRQHLSLELFDAVERGDADPGEVFDLLYRHVNDFCPHCRAVLAEVSRRGATSGPFFSSFSPEREAWRERAEARAKAFEGERQKTRLWVEALLAAPAKLQCEMAETGVEGGAAAATLILEKSLSNLPGQPQEALALARLAGVVACQAPVSNSTRVAYGRAMAHRGNAQRALGQLKEASETLGDARFLLDSVGGGGVLVKAELASFEGSLRRAERRFPEAIELLQFALDIYVSQEQTHPAVVTALRLGLVYRECDQLENGLKITREVLQVLDPAEEPRLACYTRHNLALLLFDAKRTRLARRLLARNTPFYARYPDPCSELRHLWLEGKIARQLGEARAAEQAFLGVRNGFLHQGNGFDAALVSLDLAALYLAEGRTADVKRLAEGMVPVFSAQGVHREAARALELLQEAVRREALTMALLAELASFLEASRRDPALVFRPSLFGDL